jgi:tetratricopeptide (TPR) repeat protein
MCIHLPHLLKAAHPASGRSGRAGRRLRAALRACAGALLAAAWLLAPPLAAAQPGAGDGLKRIPRAAPPAEPESAPEEPAGGLTGSLVYEFLVGEVAAQRGEPRLAAQAYADLARKTRDPWIAKRATELAWLAHMPQLAADAAQLWTEIEPQSGEAQVWQLQIWVASGRLEEARPGLERMLARSQSEQTFLQLGRLIGQVADKPAALRLMQALAEPYGELAAAHMAIAQVAAAGEDEATALSEAEAAVKLRPGWELPVLLEAGLLQKKDPARAIERLRVFLDSNPKSAEVRLAYARALAGARQYDAARAQFQQLLQNYPDNVNVVYPVALLSLELEDYGQAEAALKHLLDLDFNDPDLVMLYLGQATQALKRYPEALQWYEKVGPGEHYLTAQIRGAMVVALQGDVEGARRLLHDVPAGNDPDRVKLELAETQILREAKRTEEAFQLAAQALERMPEDPDLIYDYAMLAERLNRLDVMEANLRKLISLKPDQAQAYNALGYSLADRGLRLPEARELIEKAHALSPEDLFIVDSLGWVMYRSGDLNGALAQLQRAYGGHTDPEIAAHLGEVLWRLGRGAEARKVWLEAEKRSPGNETLEATLKRFLPAAGGQP